MITLQDAERLIASALHSGNVFFDVGTVTGTTITFEHKFVTVWIVDVSPVAATGTPESHVVSINKTGDFYTTATITNAGCDSVGWFAIGSGISA